LARTQVVLYVSDSVDIGDVLDATLVFLMANRAAQDDFAVDDLDPHVTQVQPPVVVQPLHDHRPEHPVGMSPPAPRHRAGLVEMTLFGARPPAKEVAGPVHP